MPQLFTPLALGPLTLPNRIVIAPMCQYSAVDGNTTDWHLVHLGQLALSGAGLLIVEATAVSAEGRITPGCLGLYNDANEAALSRVLQALRNTGTPMPLAIQLGHAGRKASSHTPWDGGQQIPLDQGGWLAQAPSALPHIGGELPPAALDDAGLQQVQDDFVAAARRAVRLGFQAIELHAAHGYLLHQFLSPISNQRSDPYGGSLDKRLRFPLEVFEAVTRGRIVYRVSDFDGGFLSGYQELPKHNGVFPKRTPYAALASFYEDKFEGDPVRVVALLQPVYDGQSYRMVTVQVAETLELRKSLAQQGLISTLDRQVIFLMILSVLMWWLIGRGLRPISVLRRELLERDPDSLSPLVTPAPRELRPIVEALNEVMARLKGVLDNRQRFVRDASHQLRTPLAVLKAQVQNAQRGDLAPDVAFAELSQSVDRATRVANQMLALAKVAQLESEAPEASEQTELVSLARDLAVECSPLLADKALDFALEAPEHRPVVVAAHEWMIRELLRNLVSNAIRHTPPGSAIGIDIVLAGRTVLMSVWDSGPGLDAEREAKLFEPFSSGDPNSGSGLGLVICRDICRAVGARLTLRNRSRAEPGVSGLRVTVEMSYEDAPVRDIATA